MRDRLIVALDVPDMNAALAMREKIGFEAGWLKVGLRLFVAEGPAVVRKLAEEHKIFLDLKFHDIPNTVAEAVESAGRLGVKMLNVHASGGPDMLKRASEAASEFPDMKLIAVTVLTSDPMPAGDAVKTALERARMAQDAGLDGVVCSVHEVAAIKQACGAGFITVTPGIRWGGQPLQDQKRIADPGYAIESGSDYLVVGRPVLQAAEPALAAREAVTMMEAAGK
ncbi:MAG: orotidine-5'-phosphate decarboxylase [Mariprofundaceae bacterium]|nr:orotidine-5'-phosphate decarboxylase [Mariprofundaceae bacterium]